MKRHNVGLKPAYRLTSAVLILGLVGSVGSCRSKKQYGDGEVPTPHDREATFKSDDSTSVPTDQDVAGLSIEELRQEYRTNIQKPIIWNKQAGDLVIGETDYKGWRTNTLLPLSDKGIGLTYFPEFVPFNRFIFESGSACYRKINAESGEAECDTPRGIRIYGGYMGPLEVPNGEGLVNIKIDQELKGFPGFDAEKEIGAGRGETFFKRFYNHYILNAETDLLDGQAAEDYDCFAEQTRYCNATDLGGAWTLAYQSPRGEEGWLLLTNENNKFIGANFVLPESNAIAKLSDLKNPSRLDLRGGKFVQGDEVVLALGQKYSDVKSSLELSENIWLDSGSNRNRLCRSDAGTTLCFQKTDLNRLLNEDYTYAEPSADDPLVSISADTVYKGDIQYADDKSFKLLNTQIMGPNSRALLFAQLTEYQQVLDTQFKGAVIESYIENAHLLFGEQIDYRLIVTVLNEAKDGAFRIVVAGNSETPELSVSVSQFDPQLFQMLSGAPLSAGPLELGSTVELVNINASLRAAVLKVGDLAFKVSYNENQALRVLELDETQFYGYREKTLGATRVSLGELEAYLSPIGPGTYRVAAISKANFFSLDGDKTKSIAGLGLDLEGGINRAVEPGADGRFVRSTHANTLVATFTQGGLRYVARSQDGSHKETEYHVFQASGAPANIIFHFDSRSRFWGYTVHSF